MSGFLDHVGVASWNANRIPCERVGEMIKELQDCVGRRILMLQEVASWPSEPAIRGWKVFHESGSAAAVLVPAELACNVRFQRNSEVTSSVLMGKLGFISAYFADIGKSMDDFEKSVLIVRMAIRKLQLA